MSLTTGSPCMVREWLVQQSAWLGEVTVPSPWKHPQQGDETRKTKLLPHF